MGKCTLGSSALVIGFMAEVLYAKGIINHLEADAIYDAVYVDDLDKIIDNISKEVWKDEGRYLRNKI